MPNSGGRQQSGAGKASSIATFGIGALVGALAAGAAWYLSSEEEHPQRSQQRYQSNHPVNRSNPPPPPQSNATEKEDDEKDRTVKVCEICFASFVELKECGVQIIHTPPFIIIAATPCGHIYCRDCILGALSVKPECPHCRSEVHEQTLRRLYM